MSDSRRRPSPAKARRSRWSRRACRGIASSACSARAGFGQVWYALDAAGLPVAIKLLHLELIRSIDALTRFARELEAIQRLEHRNVVRPLARGALDDGRPYLVLEYVDGLNLRDQIAANGPIRPEAMLDINDPLCDALSVAHATQLVHREVNPSNVIVAHDAEGLRPVLLDFGLVKLLDQDGPSLTSSRNMLGTPAAMAPEQMKGLPVDARTDVYACGLLAFHMLTGQPAFGGLPGVVQTYLQVHGPRPRPSSQVDIDPALDEPVARALAPDPADRFATASELAAAFRAIIHPTSGDERRARGASRCASRARRTSSRARGRSRAARHDGRDPGARQPAVRGPDRARSIAAALVAARAEIVAAGASVAIGSSTATIGPAGVDGAALDVESWAPYPLPVGLWLCDELRLPGEPE